MHPAAGKRIFAKGDWRLPVGWARSRDADGLMYGPAAFAQLLPELHRCALDQAQSFLQPMAGYRVERITPCDFSPHAYHVEALALLRRR